MSKKASELLKVYGECRSSDPCEFRSELNGIIRCHYFEKCKDKVPFEEEKKA